MECDGGGVRGVEGFVVGEGHLTTVVFVAVEYSFVVSQSHVQQLSIISLAGLQVISGLSK